MIDVICALYDLAELICMVYMICVILPISRISVIYVGLYGSLGIDASCPARAASTPTRARKSSAYIYPSRAPCVARPSSAHRASCSSGSAARGAAARRVLAFGPLGGRRSVAARAQRARAPSSPPCDDAPPSAAAPRPGLGCFFCGFWHPAAVLNASLRDDIAATELRCADFPAPKS